MDTEEANHATVIFPLLVIVLISILGGFKRDHAVFKVADFARWNVVVTGAQLIEELKTAQKDQISLTDTHNCAGLTTNHVLSSALSTRLTRNLPVVIPEMRDEVVRALSEVILEASSSPCEDENASGWRSVPVADVLTEVVSRVCNRVIVGSQLCRSAELTSLSKEHIQSTWIRSAILAIFSTSMCTILLNLFGGVSWQSWRLRRALRTIIKQQREKPSKHTQETQHDLLSSLVSEHNTGSDEIANTLLALNLQAIPSCTLNLTNALYHLAASNKSTMQPMRKEIEDTLRSADGWTTPALDRMVKLDSFLKETMRLSGLDALRRIAVVPYTFSDGTYLPQGTHLSVACTSAHFDESKYNSPTTFDAFRFASETGPRYHLTTAAPDFLGWGLGRDACPGRFFAGAVMKLVLAHVVLLYDVRFPEEDEKVPEVRWVGAKGIPNLERRILLRKR
ncbi:hypothetical protein C0995_004273 [Termitomyces sp. Mi166|nr:hypothetical protein C0995_004273 [Termitomyces sp. Mi166\